jgi:predicted DNA-binding ribbon-helix-helix protein
LDDAAIDRLSADGRLGIAYNATLQLATLALAASGYRPTRIRGHERAIQSLRHTVGLDRNLVDTLDAVRRKRNLSNYKRAGTASPSEAEDVYQLAQGLRLQVVTWLEEHYPELLTADQPDR